jgi:phenylpropionate dioxygenase-like ring-hydroxylating dioxygenase large terminal subunit
MPAANIMANQDRVENSGRESSRPRRILPYREKASARTRTTNADRVNAQDFAACERCQPAMASRAYARGGVLVPSEHHIGAFHDWLTARLGTASTDG